MSGFGVGPYSAIPWGAAGDESVVSDFQPFVGANLRRLDVISFDVTNNAWPFTADIMFAFSTGEFESVWVQNGFSERYWRGSIRIPIDNGYHYILRRTGGWPGRLVDVEVTATDFAGNVVSGHSS